MAVASEPVILDHDYFMGVDLGQSSDPTAIAVLERTVEQVGLRAVPGRSEGATAFEPITTTRYDVRHLERLPLRTPYPGIVQHVGDLLARPPLPGACDLVIDQTGVGAAVGDMLSHLYPVRVTITAGLEPAGCSRDWHVPKHVLISTLDARLSCGELRFAADLLEAPALAGELQDFRRKVSEAGRASYAARVGRHDDLVLAVAIALWWASQPRPKLAWSN